MTRVTVSVNLISPLYRNHRSSDQGHVVKFEVFTAMKIHEATLWAVTPCSDVVGHQRFGGPYCLHLQVVTPCSNAAGYQRFGELYCLHLQVVTPCRDVVGYQRFGGPYRLHLQG
jgi:hypothetical protein